MTGVKHRMPGQQASARDLCWCAKVTLAFHPRTPGGLWIVIIAVVCCQPVCLWRDENCNGSRKRPRGEADGAGPRRTASCKGCLLMSAVSKLLGGQ
jgi:hypothetical protein